jgi:hypothetical protein
VDDDEEELVDPVEYAARSGIDKETYERRVVEAVRFTLCEEPCEHYDEVRQGLVPARGIAWRWTVERVEVDSDDRLVVTFTADELRPGHTIVWRQRIWPVPPPNDEDGTPEALGDWLAWSLEEIVGQGGRVALSPADENRVVLLDDDM